VNETSVAGCCHFWDSNSAAQARFRNSFWTHLLIVFALHQLSEVSFGLDRALILALLITLLYIVQNPLDCTTTDGALANFELAG
jgi:hypothetical protein